ncbi:MAG: hypothetical protein WBV39_04730 [Rudaea sp.]
MSRIDAREQVRRASLELDRTERSLGAHWQSWYARLDRQRLPLLIGGGLFSGLVLASVSPQRWSRFGAALFGGSAWLVRSPIGPVVVTALWTGIRGSARHPRVGATQSSG